jgi:hypothetical protein
VRDGDEQRQARGAQLVDVRDEQHAEPIGAENMIVNGSFSD